MISRKKSPGVLVVPLLVSVAVVLSGCSWLSKFRLDEVSDNVDYRNGSASIGKLELPPGLTAPAFDPTYTVARPLQGSATATDAPPPAQKAAVGVAVEPAQPSVQAPAGAMPAVLTQLKDGNPALAVQGTYDQVWVKTGTLLASSGLSVVGQQYEQGIYSVSSVVKEEKGLVDRMLGFFKRDDEMQAAGAVYRLVIGDGGDQSLIVVADATGAPLNKADATAILERLKAGFGA